MSNRESSQKNEKRERTDLLERLVEQNDTIIYLLKGIKFTLQKNFEEERRARRPIQKKPFVQRFEGGKIKDVNENIPPHISSLLSEENSQGEENPFAIFDSEKDSE